MDIEKPIVRDILETPGTPALSSTSDMPIVETKPDAQAVVETEKVEEPQPEATETTEESATSPESTSESGKPKKAQGVQKRLDELVRQRDEERAEKLRLLALLESKAEKPTEKAPAVVDEPEPVKPNKQDFPEGDAWDAALLAYADQKAAWTAKKEIQAAEAKRTRDAEAAAIAEGQRKLRESFLEREKKVKERYPDFDEVVNTPDVLVTTPVVSAIIESEHGPDLQYFLGKNPDEAKRIFDLPIAQQLMELGKIEARITAPSQPKPTISAAPKPISPIKPGSETVAKDPDSMSMEEYAAYRRSQGASSLRH